MAVLSTPRSGGPPFGWRGQAETATPNRPKQAWRGRGLQEVFFTPSGEGPKQDPPRGEKNFDPSVDGPPLRVFDPKRVCVGPRDLRRVVNRWCP